MTVTNTSLLGLALPTTGTESGVWGDDVNNGLTILVDMSVAGTNNITQDSDITLSVSNGNNSSTFTSTATNSTVAQYSTLNCTGARGAIRNIIAPASSRTFVVINNTTGGFAIVIKKSGGTGVSIAPNETAIVYYDSVTATDYVKVSSTVNVSSFSAGTTGFTPSTATTGAVTLSGTLATTNGGTGLTSFTANGVVYASSTSALATGSALTWNGSVFDVRGSTYIGNGSSSYYLDIGSDANNSYVRSSNQSTSFFVGTRTSIPLRFLINDSEVARFNTSGYLGIGTSSPAGKLSVTNAGGAGNYNFYTNATNIANPNSSGSEIIGSQITVGGNIILSERQPNGAYSDRTDLAFVTNTGYGIGQSEKMRLDSSGNLLVGTTSATSILTVGNGSAANKVITINGGTGGSLGAGVVLQRNSTQTAIFSTDSLIGGSADGASIWSSEATRFYTNGSNERMRIDNSGNLLLNTTSQSDSARFTLAYSTGVNNGISFVGNATSAQNACVFRNTNGQVGSIVTSGSTTTYNITSDQRLKTNIVDAPEGNIDQIKIRSFDWKSDGSHNTYGVIAQELLEVAPYAVHQPANPDEMMGVDYSKLVPMMIKEIQSLKAEVAKLKGV